MSPFARIAIKALVLLAGWVIASAGALAAVLLWMSYGGAVHPPEIAAAALGHLLNAGLTVALAAAAAGVADHPATAAILTLGFTIGTWVVSFVAAVHGGVWERLAGYTPPVMVGLFQHGLVRPRAATAPSPPPTRASSRASRRPCAWRCTSRPRIPAASTSSITRWASCGACCPA